MKHFTKSVFLMLHCLFFLWLTCFHTASSVSAETNASTPPDLLLDLRSEGNILDSSAATRNCETVGTLSYPSGREGKGISFNGNAWIDTGIRSEELGAEFTFECWVNPANQQGFYAGLFGNETMTGNGFTLDQDGANVNHYTANFGTGDGSYVKTRPIALVGGSWQHVAYVKTRQGNALYLNGLLVAEVQSDRPMTASPGTLCVGRGGSGVPPFQGLMDNIRIWKKALTEFPHANISPAERVKAMAQSLEIVVAAIPNQQAPSSPAQFHLALNEAQIRLLPKEVTEVHVTVTAAHMRFSGQTTETKSLSDVILKQASNYAVQWDLPPQLPSGCWWIKFTPVIHIQGESVEGKLMTFSLVIPESPQILPDAPADDNQEEPFPDHSLKRPLKGPWHILIDPDNQGKTQKWYEKIPPDSQPASVPGTIQQNYPGYHGVAWYWKEFSGSAVAPHYQWWLYFGSVDHYVEVWLNGKRLGDHEGADLPFEFSGTKAWQPEGKNLLAVRVINPGHQMIDNFCIQQVPHSFKQNDHYDFGGNANSGGLLQSVELRQQPVVRITDLFVKPDSVTGQVCLQFQLENDTLAPVFCSLRGNIQQGQNGRDTLACARQEELVVQPGIADYQFHLQVDNPCLWSPRDPQLYLAEFEILADLESEKCSHTISMQFGFRDFRVGPDGYFRLNGRRLFLKSCHTVNNFPVAIGTAHQPEMFTRDLLYAKGMGFDMVRFLGGPPTPEQLRFCDEIGLLIYAEPRASWQLNDSPWMKERYDRSLAQMILRNRNHPCIVIWGLLNETPDGPVFRHAVDSLPLVRALDDTRLVLLQSGRQFDNDLSIGSLSNPGKTVWEYLWGDESPEAKGTPPQFGTPPTMGDLHTYPWVPHTPDQIHLFRTMSGAAKPLFLSEYGVGSLVNPFRLTRLHEQNHAPQEAEDFTAYRNMSEKLIADLKKFGMEDLFVFPEDLIRESERMHVLHHTIGYNAIRSNPNLCGYSLTGIIDQPAGEGLLTEWRELKHGIMDGMVDCLAPLRWCLFVEPMHVYANRTFQIEAVLANDGILGPGEYPARFKISGPSGVVWEDSATVKIPFAQTPEEIPLAMPVLQTKINLDEPAGRYVFVAELEHGGAARGNRLEFYLSRTEDFPKHSQTIAILGLSQRVCAWLNQHGVKQVKFDTEAGRSRSVILVGEVPRNPDPTPIFRALAQRMAQGVAVVFLEPRSLVDEAGKTKYLPLQEPGFLRASGNWVYHREDVARQHPVFDGLPAGGVLNWYDYGPLVPDRVFEIPEAPSETAAACFGLGNCGPGTRNGYDSGLLIGTYRFGAGSFVLSTLRILDNVDTHPAADRLLLNLIGYAAKQAQDRKGDLTPEIRSLIDGIGSE